MTSIDEFLMEYADPHLRDAGFYTFGRRTYFLRAQNSIWVQFRDMSSPDHLHFLGEWSVIPRASLDFFSSAYPDEAPNTLWGVLAGRIEVPAERIHLAVSFASPSSWAFDVPGHLGEGGSTLRAVLTEHYIPWLTGLTSSDRLLDAYDQRERRFGVPSHTPSTWPARYVAVHIDDGDIATLQGMLSALRESGQYPEWVEWWSRRLDGRAPGSKT